MLTTLLVALIVAMVPAAAEAGGSKKVRKQARQVYASAVRFASATRTDYARAHRFAVTSAGYARRAERGGQRVFLGRAKVSLNRARQAWAAERRRRAAVTSPAPKPRPNPPSSSPRLPLGLSYGNTLTWMTDAELAAALDDAVALGLTTIRTDISWQSLMPESASTTHWNRSDRVIAAARARGLDVLGVIAYTPAWARAADCTSNDEKCAPADPHQFAQFAGRVAERYASQGVDTFEIWNEMNWPKFQNKPNPEKYGALLRASIASIRVANPSATILMGGLVPTRTESGAINHGDFLRRACAGGNCLGLSGVAFHPYTYPVLASANTSWHTPWERMTKDSNGELALKSAMTRSGLGTLKIWVTEFGAPTRGTSAADGSAVTAPGTDHVTEAFQARIVADGIATAVRQSDTVGGLWLYTNRDSVQGSWYDSFGLRRIDGMPKPAFDAVRSAVRAAVDD